MDYGGMTVTMSQFVPEGHVIISGGTGNQAYVGMDTGFAPPLEPPARQRRANQNFYRRLVDYYFDLDEDRTYEIVESEFVEGEEVDYKKVYEKLRENF